MFIIENDILKIAIQARGAELNSIFHKTNRMEYMWNGDPAYWGKKSPVLFPIVGTLKEDHYYFEAKPYLLSRHGFARESDFIVTEQTETGIRFSLGSTSKTLKQYPFEFLFSITYTLLNNRLSVTYTVKNEGASDMYFSVGGHPAFKVPLAEGTRYEDYYLEFETTEHSDRWPISKDGLIETESVPLLEDTNNLPLTKELFSADALVFKGLSSSSVSLKSDKTSHGLHFDFTGFPYLGIWAANMADFVCIEPWCGIADSVLSQQLLTEKEGIIKLERGGRFERTWSLEVF
jgi:galactose mutarotase-like enzyme